MIACADTAIRWKSSSLSILDTLQARRPAGQRRIWFHVIAYIDETCGILLHCGCFTMIKKASAADGGSVTAFFRFGPGYQPDTSSLLLTVLNNRAALCLRQLVVTRQDIDRWQSTSVNDAAPSSGRISPKTAVQVSSSILFCGTKCQSCVLVLIDGVRP